LLALERIGQVGRFQHGEDVAFLDRVAGVDFQRDGGQRRRIQGRLTAATTRPLTAASRIRVPRPTSAMRRREALTEWSLLRQVWTSDQPGQQRHGGGGDDDAALGGLALGGAMTAS
jgi:hypothetical protein